MYGRTYIDGGTFSMSLEWKQEHEDSNFCCNTIFSMDLWTARYCTDRLGVLLRHMKFSFCFHEIQENTATTQPWFLGLSINHTCPPPLQPPSISTSPSYYQFQVQRAGGKTRYMHLIGCSETKVKCWIYDLIKRRSDKLSV